MQLILIFSDTRMNAYGFRIDDENSVGELSPLSTDNSLPIYDRTTQDFPDETKFSNDKNYRFPSDNLRYIPPLF